MQQPAGLRHLADDIAHDRRRAALIDGAHIEDVDAAQADCVALGRIDRADAELEHIFGRHQRPIGRQDAVEAGLAAEEGDRHAVHVARRRGRRRVEIGMRVEPQHEQRAVDLRGMARDARNAAHRQAVVAAQEHRESAALHRPVGRVLDGACPAGDLGRIERSARQADRSIGDRRDVTVIGDLIAERGKRCLELGDPQRCRAHDAAAAAGADVDRRADQVDIVDLSQPCPHLLLTRSIAWPRVSQIDEILAI